MCIILVFLISASIPEGWPMLRCNHPRTGYTPGVSCFNNVQEMWSLLIQDSEGDIIFSSPLSADFDSDNKKDVLIGASHLGSYPTAELYRGYDGVSLWSSDVTGDGPGFCTPALMDIDGDNKPEVFLHEEAAGFRCISGATGTELWRNASVVYSVYSASLVIEGAPGIVVTGDINGTLWSLNATTGTENWSYAVGKHIQPVSLGDVDNDGSGELVVIAGTSLFVFEVNGNTPTWSMDIGDSATTPMLVNLDGDAALEIVVYCYNTGYVKAFNYNNTTPFLNVSVGAFTPDWSGCYNTVDYWPPSPAGGDVTGDGIADIFIHNGNNLYCIDGSTGSVLWNPSLTHLFGSPVLADLDNDGDLEIVVTGCPGDDGYRSKVECYDHTGVEKWEWRCPIGSGFPDPILNEACLADLDGDGRLEITTADYSCWLLALDCEPSGIEERDLINQDLINQIPTILNTIFTSQVKLIIPGVNSVEYVLYDIGGRIIEAGSANVGPDYNLTLHFAQVKSGVYFLRIKLQNTAPLASGFSTQTFKLLKLL